MSTRAALAALIRKRQSQGRWVYLLWLAAYCVLAFVAIVYAAVLGQDYVSAFAFFVVPALVGYLQFRYPTVLGWVVLFVPTLLFAIIASLLFLSGAAFGMDLTQLVQSVMLLLTLGTVTWGFIHYRPFGRKNSG